MGGRFCRLDQTLSECKKYFSGNYVFPSLKMSEDQKKGLHRKLKSFYPQNQVKTKKKVFTAIWDYIRLEFVGFMQALFRLLNQRSNLEGRTLTIHGGC